MGNPPPLNVVPLEDLKIAGTTDKHGTSVALLLDLNFQETTVFELAQIMYCWFKRSWIKD